MRIVVQRVSHASVTINGTEKSSISRGLLVLLGIAKDDNQSDIDYLVKKLINLRIFDDSDGVMNLSVQDINGDIMLISQFTLMAATKKGNRPSYIRAAGHDISIPLYEAFISSLEAATGKKTATGEFGADMKISLLNDGPVTIIIDSKQKDL
jgi:D-tyrosyl-tRNA(Tyr) deacylase